MTCSPLRLEPIRQDHSRGTGSDINRETDPSYNDNRKQSASTKGRDGTRNSQSRRPQSRGLVPFWRTGVPDLIAGDRAPQSRFG